MAIDVFAEGYYRPQVVVPLYCVQKWGITVGAYPPGQNETDYGDSPQSPLSADKILGRFVFNVEGGKVHVRVESHGKSVRYHYSYVLVVQDGLGFNDWRRHLQVCPPRPVVRARWHVHGTLQLK